jgi:alpha-D-ribose 1-methylphosphonate 5-triphosphate diphosphatase PhnM
MPQSEWADWMTEKLTELVAKLSIEDSTPGDEIWNRIEKYFNENPVNQQLQQDSISSIREEVPASADAFTIRWRSKYAG